MLNDGGKEDDFPKSELAFDDLGPLTDEKLSSVHLPSRNIAQNRPISPENLKISEGNFLPKSMQFGCDLRSGYDV